MSLTVDHVTSGQVKRSYPSLDHEADATVQNIDKLEALFKARYGAEASDVVAALEQLKGVAAEAKVKADTSTPFDFDDSLTFSYRGAIAALGQAISNLLAMQPQIIAAKMAISTEAISPQIDKWSQGYLAILQYYQKQINNLNPDDKNFQKDLAALQGDMSVANSASSASATGLNGVLSMLTAGTSSETSTYQSLINQISSVVTALLNAMATNWSSGT